MKNSSSNKKILIATPNDGGPATYSKLLSQSLPSRGFSVRIVNFGDVLHFPKIVRHLFHTIKLIYHAFWADIIYAQDPVSNGFPALIASRLTGTPLYLKIVGDYAWEQGSQRSGITDFLDAFSEEFDKYPFFVRLLKRVQKSVANGAKKIIVPSEYLKKIVSNWGVSRDKITVIYNAFDEPHVYGSKEEIRHELHWTSPTIVSVGRLVPWKGFVKIIAILPDLLRKHPDLILYIVGDGPDRAYLESAVKQHKVEENVVLTGKMSHSDTLRYMKAGDMFVLNTSYEGLSHVLLEAFAVETPIITTPAGGNVETIEPNKNGILIPYNDAEEFKKAILSFIENPDLAHTIARAGKVKLQDFSEEKMLSHLSQVLKQ